MESRFNPNFDLFSPDAMQNFGVVDDEILDLDALDYTDPSTFGKLYGVNPERRSAGEVRREARDLSDQIWASFDSLHEIIVHHEALLQKRWTKKPKQQRLKILLEAWPTMPLSHRPDFHAFRKESLAQRKNGTKYRDHFLWPDFNQEDLLKPKILPLLLRARGRHPPTDFAAAEIEAIHIGIASKAVIPIFLYGHVMILHGARSAREYGKLLSWEDHPNAVDWLYSQSQFGPGEGLLVLQIQQRIMAFLVNCCRQILHDNPGPQNFLCGVDPVRPSSHLKREGELLGFESLAVMTAEAPYRAPAQLDLGRIVALLAARVSAGEDHLWALREDPAYFVEQVLSTKEHRREMLEDINGKKHPTMLDDLSGQNTVLWARIFGSVVIEAYLDLELTSELLQQGREVRKLQAKYSKRIKATESLPREYLDGLLKFRFYLNQATRKPAGQLEQAFAASPPLRKFFVRQPPANETTSMIAIQSKPGVELTGAGGELLWLLRMLWEDGNEPSLFTLPLAVDELERLIQSEREARDLVSGTIAELIGSLSIFSQCLRQVDLYLPWARSYKNHLVVRIGEFQREFSKRAELWMKLDTTLEDKNLVRIVQHGNFSDKTFVCPFGRRKSKENVQQLRKAEQNLDKFWAEIDRLVYAECGDLHGTALRHLLSQPRFLQRTPEWVEAPKAAVAKTVQANPSTGDSWGPLSTLYFNLGDNACPSRCPNAATRDSETKPKVKTRSSIQATSDSVPATDDAPEDNPAPTIIQVDARCLKVFRALFFNPDVTSSPGEISWTDFLHAMTLMGLFAAEKLYGSVWQFQHLGASDQSRIQFHEPHPRGKLSFTVARRIGRRITRAFGWVGETFVLKDKTSKRSHCKQLDSFSK